MWYKFEELTLNLDHKYKLKIEKEFTLPTKTLFGYYRRIQHCNKLSIRYCNMCRNTFLIQLNIHYDWMIQNTISMYSDWPCFCVFCHFWFCMSSNVWCNYNSCFYDAIKLCSLIQQLIVTVLLILELIQMEYKIRLNAINLFT